MKHPIVSIIIYDIIGSKSQRNYRTQISLIYK